MELRSLLQGTLEDAGFSTRLIPIDKEPCLCFEDESIVGFGFVLPNAAEIIGRWHHLETSVLSQHKRAFRLAGDKAWNVYCAFLSESIADLGTMRELRAIEENLERTRKLASAGLSARPELLKALLPILPLQYEPLLMREDANERLRNRIAVIAPSVRDVILDDAVSPAEIVRLLGGPA